MNKLTYFLFARCVVAALFFALTVATFGQSANSNASFVYGVWKIRSVSEVGGHGSEVARSAEKEIGKKIEFREKRMSYEAGSLFFDGPCTRAEYGLKKQKLGRRDVGVKGTLEFYDLVPKRRGWIEHIIVKCENGNEYQFELAKEKDLAIYYDGWFFFFEKVAK